MLSGFLLHVIGHLNFTVLLLKFGDALADEVEDLFKMSTLFLAVFLVPFPNSDLSMSIFIFFNTIPNQDQNLAVRASSFIVSDHMELVQHGLVDADG